MTPFTPDELDLMAGKEPPPPASDADAGEGFPVAEGVDPDRATRWALYDRHASRYVNGTVRTRKPTLNQQRQLDADRFEWRRV